MTDVVWGDFWRSDEAWLGAAQHSMFLGEGKLFQQRLANFHPPRGNHCISQERKHEFPQVPPKKQKSWDGWTSTHIICARILKIRPENALPKLIWKGKAGFRRERLAEDGMCIICTLTQPCSYMETPAVKPFTMHRKHLTWFIRTFWIKWSWSLVFHKTFADSVFFMDLPLSNCYQNSTGCNFFFMFPEK